MKLTDEAITEVYKGWLKSGSGYIEYARAIESAIAPPVAAGSVDTESRKLAVKFDKEAREQRQRAENAEAEYKIVCDKNDILRKYCEAAQANEEKWQGKAEKAEADVLYLKKTYAGLFDERTTLEQRAEKAEARILELQRALLDKVEEDLK